MKGAIIFVFVIFIILIGIVVVIYYTYEKEVQEIQIEYADVNIIAFEKDSLINIPTNYIIALGNINNIYKNGTTLNKGYILEKVPVNNTVFIYNKNTDTQVYYTDMKSFSSYDIKLYRATLVLEKSSNLTFKQLGAFGVDKDIKLNISSSGTYKNPKLCVKWSLHIITLRLDDVLPIIKPEDRKDMDKCYKFNKDVYKNESFLLNINYKYFGEITPSDYIRLVFFDGDEVNMVSNNITYIIKK